MKLSIANCRLPIGQGDDHWSVDGRSPCYIETYPTCMIEVENNSFANTVIMDHEQIVTESRAKRHERYPQIGNRQ